MNNTALILMILVAGVSSLQADVLSQNPIPELSSKIWANDDIIPLEYSLDRCKGEEENADISDELSGNFSR